MSRILVVDDDPASCDVMTYFLKSLGYHVVTAPDGIRALNMDLADDIGLVILDVHMPRHEGPELLAMLRETRTGGSVSVIALTRTESPDMQVLMFALGIDGCLTKPVDLGHLREQVTRLLPDHAPPEGALRRRVRERGAGSRLEALQVDPRAVLVRNVAAAEPPDDQEWA